MKAPLLQIQAPGAHRPHGLPLLRLGFRPFYLGAAALATTHVLWWALVNTGVLEWNAALPALWWHAHEMLFGFAAAVITGFLFTAGRNWTQLPTPRGAPLAALVLLWLAARVAAVAAPAAVFMLLDLALLPLVALVLLRLLLRAGNHRNLPLVGIVLLLALANLGFHLAAAGLLPLSPLQALHTGLALVVVLETVMGGRVIPGFTMSVLPGVRIAPRSDLDRASVAVAALALLLWVVDAAPAPLTGSALLLAAALHTLRAWRWQPWRGRHLPMLAVLHAAYAWIPVGLLLLGLAQWGWVATTLGVHALAVGATGGLILGMMMRTARGHTGRSLQPTRWEVLALALVVLAALVRVLPLLLWPSAHQAVVLAAAALWSLAFGIYLWVYLPWLLAARLDGRDG